MADLSKLNNTYPSFAVKTQFNFDMENRVRSLCHDMMQSMH